MSAGPGRVERALLRMIEPYRGMETGFGTGSLVQAAFDVTVTTADLLRWNFCGSATKAQRVSALRAMHRIAAREPGWTVEHQAGAVRFRWHPPRRGRRRSSTSS